MTADQHHHDPAAPRPHQPSPAEAQRLGDAHFVDRYDRAQLALLDRLHRLDQAATPLVVPRGTNRVYRAEPRHHRRGPRARLILTGAEPLATRDAVVTLLDLGLIHGHYLAPLDPDPRRPTGADEPAHRARAVADPTRPRRPRHRPPDRTAPPMTTTPEVTPVTSTQTSTTPTVTPATDDGDDLLSHRLRAPGYREWRAQVHATGGCAAPIHLSGSSQILDRDGAVLLERDATVLAPCGNRRTAGTSSRAGAATGTTPTTRDSPPPPTRSATTTPERCCGMRVTFLVCTWPNDGAVSVRKARGCSTTVEGTPLAWSPARPARSRW